MNPTKIVLTGGPSSGKTSVWELLRQSSPSSIFVPEVAGILLSGGFPIPTDNNQIKVFQKSMPPLQKRLEEMVALQSVDWNLMVLDRATLDGYGYWPWDQSSFLQEMSLSLNAELESYDWILWFQMPEKKYFGSNNPHRFHDYEQSCQIGERQRKIWSNHPHFLEIPAIDDFSLKTQLAVEIVHRIGSGSSKADLDALIQKRSRPTN